MSKTHMYLSEILKMIFYNLQLYLIRLQLYCKEVTFLKTG